MATEYDSNMIKPVDGLQNITGLAPARRREQRSRRQKLNQKNEKNEEQEFNELDEEQDQENSIDGLDDNCSEKRRIDFHA